MIPVHEYTVYVFIFFQCAPNGRAGKAGMQAGDMVLSICGMATQGMTHMQIKQEILRCGNELDFVLQRLAIHHAEIHKIHTSVQILA
jgi:hypothetical protein